MLQLQIYPIPNFLNTAVPPHRAAEKHDSANLAPVKWSSLKHNLCGVPI